MSTSPCQVVRGADGEVIGPVVKWVGQAVTYVDPCYEQRLLVYHFYVGDKVVNLRHVHSRSASGRTSGYGLKVMFRVAFGFWRACSAISRRVWADASVRRLTAASAVALEKECIFTAASLDLRCMLISYPGMDSAGCWALLSSTEPQSNFDKGIQGSQSSAKSIFRQCERQCILRPKV